MQEIRLDGTEQITFDPTMVDMLKAMENPQNREVRIIPDIREKQEYYVIKKKGKWVKRRH